MSQEPSEALKYIIESLIFVSDGPLSYNKIKKLLPDFEPDKIREALSELLEDYEKQNNKTSGSIVSW